MATLHLVLAAILLASAHAQYDFCVNGPTRHLRDDVDVKEHVETKFFAVGEEPLLPRLADSDHDLVEGNCTGDIGDPIIVNDDCLDPNPFGVAMHGHGYLFMDKTISCIKVVDRFEDGSGGFPSISSGGVGRQSVELMFTSQEYKGLKFYTEIYAAYVPPLA